MFLFFSCRHQFYLHAKSDLMEGKLKVGQEIEPLKLIALLSQSELGDYESCIAPMQMYNSWCHQLNIEASEEELETIAALHKEMKVGYFKVSNGLFPFPLTIVCG